MNNIALFDTHLLIKQLKEKGMPEEQAEAVVNVVRDSRNNWFEQLATKTELKSEMQQIKSDMQLLEQHIMIKLGSMIIVATAFLAGIQFFIR